MGGGMSDPVFDSLGYFQGWQPRECGEHRTVGEHRAWCFDCHEWCYPNADGGCAYCRIPMLEARLAAPASGQSSASDAEGVAAAMAADVG